MVGSATCWLHPQAIYGLPPFNKASLGIIKQGCLGLKEVANDRQGRLELEEELGLGKDRQDLCDRLEAQNAQRERETGGRCLTDDSIKEVDVPFPPWFSFTR